MTDRNWFRRTFMRFARWIEGEEPEDNKEGDHVAWDRVKTTKEMREEHLENTVKIKGHYQNKGLRKRYFEWESGSGKAFFQSFYRVMSVLICIVIICLLLLVTSHLPAFGDASNPAHNEVFEKYIEDTLDDTNATNAVAGVILDYRAFDTFGEATVLFIAACAVTILLRQTGDEKKKQQIPPANNDMILTKVSSLIIPIVMLYGVYVILNGHISPGGGFSGGTLIGAGLILYLSTFGSVKMSRIINYRKYLFINLAALSFYALAKGYSFFTGANHLESGIPHGTPGAILSGGLILPLNIAVGVVVACTMYGFYSLFSREDI